jgi:hypothetical protein
MNYRLIKTLVVAVLLIAAFGAVGTYTYNLGIARGIAESGQLAGTVTNGANGAPIVAFWPRPWGFGFGFFPFFPLLFILFWIFVARALFWRGHWHRGYGNWGPWGRSGVPPVFEEWHRRMHEQQPPASPTKL